MRRFVVVGGLVVLVVALVIAGVGTVLYTRADVSTVDELEFSQRLAIPPLLEPRRDAAGRRFFDLTLQEGRAELLPGKATETWGVNGPYLGPTLRASRGDAVRMRVRNELPETTTLHWHGMHLPAAADGGPHQPIEPGRRWEPAWTIDQPAATLWYHPHPHGDTADHVLRGIAGMFILDDRRSRTAGLPDDYGVDDVPVILQDPQLSDEGELDFSAGMISPIGRLGDRTLVNGTYGPYLPVSRRLVRFRLLNASQARIYDVGFADGRELVMVGADGGLLDEPRRVRRLRLSPGDRAEVLAEFRPGERAVLRSFEPDLGADFFNERFSGGDDSFDLLEVRAARTLAPARRPHATLAPGDRIDPAQSVRTRRFELSGNSSINGEEMDMDRIDQVMVRGTTETWIVENSAGIPHSFHPHDMRFRVLSYDGRPPPAEVAGLQDTVYVPPDTTIRVVTRLEDYADADGPYMFHCHVLQHEDRGMMGQFVVVDREGRAGAAPGHAAHDHGD